MKSQLLKNIYLHLRFKSAQFYGFYFTVGPTNCQVIVTHSTLPIAGIFRISVMFQDNNGRTWQSGTKSNIAM
jgi:hypothetical protein